MVSINIMLQIEYNSIKEKTMKNSNGYCEVKLMLKHNDYKNIKFCLEKK